MAVLCQLALVAEGDPERFIWELRTDQQNGRMLNYKTSVLKNEDISVPVQENSGINCAKLIQHNIFS